jgi:hypothetical protein
VDLVFKPLQCPLVALRRQTKSCFYLRSNSSHP